MAFAQKLAGERNFEIAEQCARVHVDRAWIASRYVMQKASPRSLTRRDVRIGQVAWREERVQRGRRQAQRRHIKDTMLA